MSLVLCQALMMAENKMPVQRITYNSSKYVQFGDSVDDDDDVSGGGANDRSIKQTAHEEISSTVVNLTAADVSHDSLRKE